MRKSRCGPVLASAGPLCFKGLRRFVGFPSHKAESVLWCRWMPFRVLGHYARHSSKKRTRAVRFTPIRSRKAKGSFRRLHIRLGGRHEVWEFVHGPGQVVQPAV